MGNESRRDEVTGRPEPVPDPELVFGNQTVDGLEPDHGAQVIPFPCEGRGLGRHGDDRWEFRTDVRRIGGAEGAWLRRELATVIRDLVVWAHDDMSGRTGQDHGREERAA